MWLEEIHNGLASKCRVLKLDLLVELFLCIVTTSTMDVSHGNSGSYNSDLSSSMASSSKPPPMHLFGELNHHTLTQKYYGKRGYVTSRQKTSQKKIWPEERRTIHIKIRKLLKQD